MEIFAQKAVTLLNPVLSEMELPTLTAETLDLPQEMAHGDFAIPCFQLAKALKKAPPQISIEIKNKIEQKYGSSTVDGLQFVNLGPYLNIHVTPEHLFEGVLKPILTGPGLGSFGLLPQKTRGTWVLEFSSPNIAKPINIYHLRGTVLGAALSRIGAYRGFNTVRINHLGDWGTQFGKLAVAYEMYQQDLPPNPKVDDLVKVYVKFHEALEKDPSLDEKGSAAFLALEQGDPKIIALWKQTCNIAISELKSIYKRIHVEFDHYWGESFYQNQMPPLLENLKKRGILVQSEGAWVIPVTDSRGKEIPPCILQKSDGATIYATRDFAAAVYREKQFHFDRMTYIVGGEQKLHFEQVFGALKKAGNEWVSKCEHIPTGLYRFKDAKMSTRKGNYVTLESVLDLARDRVKELMLERAQKDGSATLSEIEAIADIIGTGAVVFHDLKTDPARDVEFDLETVVNFDGETGPYLQYAHTRCLSILKKSHIPQFSADITKRLEKPEEFLLLRTLGQFPFHLEKTLKQSKASQLTHYLIQVTKQFNTFYHECRVVNENDKTLTEARLLLVEATRRVLGQGLTLLGIGLPEKM